ncbi:hypothetical protein ACFSL4_05070 [Streptomyces caeni]|uniref:Uncharacterized protein n=1 Tax=Streptomyces caeni TaxID=2307231 RepID=A0ABW4ILQ5_9ACTN
MENPARTHPVPLDDRIGQRVAHILGKTVVPMFNALIQSSGEHRREPTSLREDIQNVERRPCWHHQRLSALEGEAPTNEVSASIRDMTWQACQRHVADPLERGGCTKVVVRQAQGDRGIDITAVRPTDARWPSSARSAPAGSACRAPTGRSSPAPHAPSIRRTSPSSSPPATSPTMRGRSPV